MYALVLSAQSGGRFEEAKRMAMAYIGSEQYDKAAGRLEEVWEQDHSDPTVAEYLAIAYLNTEDKHSLPKLQKQAFGMLDKLLEDHSRISFIVHHSHEKAAWLQGRQWHQYCTGRFSLQDGRISFLAQKGKDAEKHSFDISLAQFKGIALDEDARGVFHVKTPKGGYMMASRNHNPDEARYLVEVVKRLQ